MDTATVTAQIRRGIREPRALLTGPTGITQSITDAINLLGEMVSGAAPEYYIKRISKQSDGTMFRFALPTDNKEILDIRDLGGNAKSVSATATDSGEIKVTTSAVHGWSDDDMVTLHDVGGCTEANGTWKIDVSTTTAFTLKGSTYANAWTSGGKVFRERTIGEFTPITRTPSKYATGDQVDKYYLRAGYIMVDRLDFDNDIIIQYRYIPTTLATIPSELHYGIVAYGVIDQIKLPGSDAPDFKDLDKSLSKHTSLWELAQEQAKDWHPIAESINYGDVDATLRVKRYI